MTLSRTPRPACPFVTGQKIKDPRCFVGRKEELRFLTDRMNGSQPESVNVVGGRLSGKSSLLWHFAQTWEQRVPNPARFVVAYLSLRFKPKNEADFYQALAKALCKLPVIEQNEPLRSALAAFSGGSSEFADVLNLLDSHSLLPVFCLDDFEKLFDHLEALNKDFYDRLRGLMSTNKMMLIIATRQTLKFYGEEHQLKSAFFNMGKLCELKEFPDDEAEELLLLPDPAAPALEADDRRLARSWGGKQPHRLQLAALYLFEAHRDGKSHAWAKRKFKAQLGQTKPDSVLTSPLRLVLRDHRCLLGQIAEDYDKYKKVLLLFGLVLALFDRLYTLLTGKMPLCTAFDWLLKLIGAK